MEQHPFFDDKELIAAEEFPMEAVMARLDGTLADAGEVNRQALAMALRTLLEWLCEPCREKSCSLLHMREAGRRLVAALWVINPGYFEGTPSGRALSKRFGMSRYLVSEPAAEFTA